MCAQAFSIAGNQLYSDPPYCKQQINWHYFNLKYLTRSSDKKGNAASLGMSVAVVLISLILRWYLAYLNSKKKEVQASAASSDIRQQSLEEAGDLHPGAYHISSHTIQLTIIIDFFYTT